MGAGYWRPDREDGGMTTCTYHGRRCGAHFTSLRAFDAHHSGHPEQRDYCSWPDDASLVERMGTCKLADPDVPMVNVTLYEHGTAQDYRERMNARLTASRHSSEGVAAA